MICSGDEISRTQKGNNNAYCQDNEISWLDWNLDNRKKALLEFTSKLIALRRNHPNLHRRKFFQDRPISPSSAQKRQMDGEEVQDIQWFRPDGQPMTEDEWKDGWVRCLGMRLSGRTIEDVDRHGEPLRDDTFLFCLNPHHEHIQFYLPKCAASCKWQVVLDTRKPTISEPAFISPQEPYDMLEHSAVLFCESEESVRREELTRVKPEQIG
jgi:glycogen operon protein